MLFNSQNFAVFFCITLFIYWLFWKWRNVQNLILLAANWYFYNKLHYSFPIYLLGIICVGYLSAILISKQENVSKRKATLITGITVLGFGLAYIKYSGLILGNIPGLDGWQASALHILVPLGISYYTFSSIGYITEVYRRKLSPERNFVTYAAYISYFPHLLSGPIPSAITVLPQFSKTRSIPSLSQIEQSIGEIIWGLFKKMVIADNVVLTVNYCFSRHQDLNGSTLFLGVTLFSLYLYADFSGYSEIARGTSRLLGIELTQNFKMPFFSRNPAEFWRRWHTSLRKWMLDYIYLPMGGNKVTKPKYIFLILFIFSFSGLWHGANYTFICWGLLNGLYFVPYILTDTLIRYKDPPAKGRILPSFKELCQILLTFNLVTITRVFFRSPDIYVVKDLFSKIFSPSLFAVPLIVVVKNVAWCMPMLVVEWFQREKSYVLEATRLNFIIRFAVYGTVVILIYYFHKKLNSSEYYYFKF